MPYSDQDDFRRWLRDRDAASFRSIAERYYPMVYAAAYRIVVHHADAEDVAQETFLKIVRNPPVNVASLGSWLHRVSTNAALDLLRRRKRRARREETYEASKSSRSETYNELDEFLDTAINDLPETYREVIVTHFLEKKSLSHMARQHRVSQQLLSYRKRKALELLRESFEKHGVSVSVATVASALATGQGAAATSSHGMAMERLLQESDLSSVGVETVRNSKIGTALSFYSKYLVATVSTIILVVAVAAFWGRSNLLALSEGSDVSSRPEFAEKTSSSPDSATVLAEKTPPSPELTFVDTDEERESANVGSFQVAQAAVDISTDPRTAQLNGILLMNDVPIPDTGFSFHPRLDPDQNEFRTDSEGRFEISGLPRNEFDVQAQIIFEDGVRQLSVITPLKLIPDETTNVKFEFSWGTTSIEGYTLQQTEQGLEPISCRLDVLYQRLDAESVEDRVTLARESLWSQSDGEGYYLVDQLAAGRVSLTIYPAGTKTYKHRRSFKIRANMRYQHDFVLGDCEIEFDIQNIPESTQSIWGRLYTDPVGLFPLTPDNGAQKMMTFEDTQIAGTIIDEVDSSGAFDGLTPGFYTVVVASYPCPATTRHIRAMGEEFLYTVGIAQKQVHIQRPGDKVTLTLDSFEFQPRP